eukprot:gene13477-biopygen25
MKFTRFGPKGAEKPGLIDAKGRLRDLSDHLDDLSGDVLTRLTEFNRLDIETLPLITEEVRLGPCVGGTGKFI